MIDILTFLYPKSNQRGKKHDGSDNVEHEAGEVRADDFEVEGESSHFCFPFRCVLLRLS